MYLSKRTQYGIRALVCFAEAYERGFLQARELSAREKLPPKFLESILNALTRGKFLISKIGASGGYRLARHPREVFLGEIIERLEGNQFLEEQPAPPAHALERPGEAAIRILQTQITDAARGVLESLSLAQLAEHAGHHGREQMYYI